MTDEFSHSVILNDLDMIITRNVSAEVRNMHVVPYSEFESLYTVDIELFVDADGVGIFLVRPEGGIIQPALGEL